MWIKNPLKVVKEAGRSKTAFICFYIIPIDQKTLRTANCVSRTFGVTKTISHSAISIHPRNARVPLLSLVLASSSITWLSSKEMASSVPLHTHTYRHRACGASYMRANPQRQSVRAEKKSWISLPFTANNCSRLSQRSPMILTFFYGPPPCEYICVWSLRGVRSRAVTWPWRGGAFPGLWMGLNLSSPLSLMRACVRCDRKR